MMQTSYKVIEIQEKEIIISSKASKINVQSDMNAEKLVFKMPRYYNDLDLTSLDLVLYIKGVDVSDILAIRGYEVVDGYIVWEFVPQGAMLLKSGYIDVQITGVQIVNNTLEVKWQTKIKENAFYINNTLVDVVETVVKPLPTELEQYRAEIVRLIESVNLDDVVMDITADTENVLVLHRGNGTHSNVALNVRGGITLEEVNQVVNTHNASADTHADIRQSVANVDSKIGSLPTLTTTNKTSTVGAINELDNEIGILSTLTTTQKASLVEAINEQSGKISTLDVKVNWKPTDWKVESSKPSEYGDTTSTTFISSAPFNGVANVIVETSISNVNRGKQIISGLHSQPLFFRLVSSRDTWGIWQQIATADKTEILCTETTGYKITKQKCWTNNGLLYINLDIAKSDGGVLPTGTSLRVADVPIAPNFETPISSQSIPEGATSRNLCSGMVHTNKGIYVTITATNNKYILVSGVFGI